MTFNECNAYKIVNVFICTCRQCPTPSTCRTFWHEIWRSDINMYSVWHKHTMHFLFLLCKFTTCDLLGILSYRFPFWTFWKHNRFQNAVLKRTVQAVWIYAQEIVLKIIYRNLWFTVCRMHCMDETTSTSSQLSHFIYLQRMESGMKRKRTTVMYISIILLHNRVLITMLNKSNDFLCEMYLNSYGNTNQVSVVQCPSRFPILIHNNFSPYKNHSYFSHLCP